MPTQKEQNRSKRTTTYRAIKEMVEFKVGKKLTDDELLKEVEKLCRKR